VQYSHQLVEIRHEFSEFCWVKKYIIKGKEMFMEGCGDLNLWYGSHLSGFVSLGKAADHVTKCALS
jgi:hypothetical protein